MIEIVPLGGLGHRAGGFARSQQHEPAVRRRRQMRGKSAGWVRGSDRSTEELQQSVARRGKGHHSGYLPNNRVSCL
jgi:hypothetical protein